uniref:Uncharacterized protein n=1 Tax=Trichinella nativa TaxID=6335 RepID=A0A0V1KHG2_9BILA
MQNAKRSKYPGNPGQNVETKPKDKENFPNLNKEVPMNIQEA